MKKHLAIAITIAIINTICLALALTRPNTLTITLIWFTSGFMHIGCFLHFLLYYRDNPQRNCRNCTYCHQIQGPYIKCNLNTHTTTKPNYCSDFKRKQ